jgi:hypothetical protein
MNSVIFRAGIYPPYYTLSQNIRTTYSIKCDTDLSPVLLPNGLKHGLFEAKTVIGKNLCDNFKTHGNQV